MHCKKILLKTISSASTTVAPFITTLMFPKREIQDGHVIKCEHNLYYIQIAYSVEYQMHRAFLLIDVGRSRERGFREALLTQHPPLDLLNILKVSFKEWSPRI